MTFNLKKFVCSMKKLLKLEPNLSKMRCGMNEMEKSILIQAVKQVAQ